MGQSKSKLLRGIGIAAVALVFLGSASVTFAAGMFRGIGLGVRGLSAGDTVDKGICVDLPNTGPLIDVVGGGSLKPAPARGGQVVDGTYHLMDFVLYGAPQGYKMGRSSSTLRVTRSSMESIAYTKILFASDVSFGRGTFRVSGNTLDMDLSCPPPDHPVSHDYTVDGDTLVLYSNERSGDVTYLALLTYKRI